MIEKLQVSGFFQDDHAQTEMLTRAGGQA